jgi:hypothetical protein
VQVNLDIPLFKSDINVQGFKDLASTYFHVNKFFNKNISFTTLKLILQDFIIHERFTKILQDFIIHRNIHQDFTRFHNS